MHGLLRNCFATLESGRSIHSIAALLHFDGCCFSHNLCLLLLRFPRCHCLLRLLHLVQELLREPSLLSGRLLRHA